MDQWGWEQVRPWLNARAELPVGPLLCIIDGPTRGRPWSGAAVRGEYRRLAAEVGVRRRFAPHQLRHAHALELAREGVPLNIIQRQLGHANLGTTSIYLQGIDPEEIIATVHMRRTPMMSASAGPSTLIKTRPLRAGAPPRSRSALTKRASERDGRDEWSSSMASVGSMWLRQLPSSSRSSTQGSASAVRRSRGSRWPREARRSWCEGGA
jgi:Phage integrase family